MDGTTGLADRIVADISGLALAVITNRAFLLAEHLGGAKVCVHTPCRHNLQLTPIDIILWSPNEAQLLVRCRHP